jgi:hypothetical protein
VAKQMIPIREWENDSELLAMLERAEKDGKDQDTPLSFRSCNYDTFIMPFKNHIVVLTCNNHPFGDIFLSTSDFIPADVIKLLGHGTTHDDLDDLRDCFNFWFLEYDVVGSSTNEFCSDHGLNKIMVDQEEICPECNKVEENKIDPEIKLVARLIRALEEIRTTKINFKEISPDFKNQTKFMDADLSRYLDKKGYYMDDCCNIRKKQNED